MLKALIFDVDGTLAETESIHLQAFNRAFKHHHLPWHWDEPLYFELLKTTGGKERILKYARDYLKSPDVPSKQRVAQIHATKTGYYVELVKNGALTLRSGVQKLMDEAVQDNLTLAIATTTSRANVDALCQSIWNQPTDKIFSVVACGDEVPAKKPAPDVYELALRRLALKASECVALEDSENGLASAHAAGLSTVVVPSRFSLDNGFCQASLRAQHFTDFALADLSQL
ncbi:MAG TPA: HAD family hydrolase [Hellea balneolensis]|uniref:HAD family hydrolase n=1 Tax=Hellea balneolensis TaxID=287478 RepID=A0A7C5QZL3_9PROT|nr:HAD family hydrolase [Hellea balneolensis]